MGEHLDRLKKRLADVQNLTNVVSVLGWDQQTYMPARGAPARAEQMATVARLAHSLFTSDETGELLQLAGEEVADLPRESDDASLVRVARRDYEQERKLPEELVAELQRHEGRANPIWVQAREESNFGMFAPCLQRTVELQRELAACIGYQDHLYDALLDRYEPGMKTAQVQSIFDELRAELVPLVQAIAERTDRVDDGVLHQPFEEVQQEGFVRMVVSLLGYDFSRGRLDRTAHPFETSFSRDDVRITTHFDPDFLNTALFGTMHEAGHGMYEQGVGESLEGTTLAGGASFGLHESQSRLWENVVGRSLPLWQRFYPLLQETFPLQLGNTSLEQFYGAINRVSPSYIRVEADEVTYNLHIMLRFEMETELLEDRYPVQDAPEVWNQKMVSYLGLRPPTHALGILQDVHWSSMMGYFPTYTLGNILSVQLYERAVEVMPEIAEDVARGEFGSLHGWLTDRVYRHGRKFEPNELVERVTGEGLGSRPYLAYLKRKYAEIYGI